MKTRTLGSHGLTTSAIGLGCMGMSQGYGPRDDEASLAALSAAVEAGITLWDTAQSYGAGHNETLLGQALRTHRARVQIATKVGIVRTPDGTKVDAKPETIRASCEASLGRLGIDTIDLYYVHRFDPQVPVEETVGAMADLVKAGKVRYVGISECDSEQIERAASVHPIAALQCEWSLWWREPEDDVIPTARRFGIGVVPYSPLGRGFLTSEAVPNELASNDFRQGDGRFTQANREINESTRAALKVLADELGLTVAQLALAWLLAQGDDVVPIPGTRKLERIAENAQAAAVSLAPETLARIDAIAGRTRWAGDRRSFAAHGVTRRATSD